MSMRALFLGALAIGCGGSTPPPVMAATQVMGSFFDKPFTATHAVAFSAAGPLGAVGMVVISTSAGLCSALQAGHLPPESRNLVIEVFDLDATSHSTAPASPGRYFVTDQVLGPDRLAGCSYVETDAACRFLAGESSVVQTGSVTLTDVASDVYAGSLSISMNPKDSAFGTIQTAPCPGAGLARPAPGC